LIHARNDAAFVQTQLHKRAGHFHPPEIMAIIVFVAFENGICPPYTKKSDNLCYGTNILILKD
ncbi:hypothetical protein ABFT80_25980, partial [Mesorhizobium sp. SB112]|uniref:hypothetical protein n=1 Tax=Mesorhizobium sp. SB112 TaxID=3151853 RepID=UPI0032657C07